MESKGELPWIAKNPSQFSFELFDIVISTNVAGQDAFFRDSRSLSLGFGIEKNGVRILKLMPGHQTGL